ncbi:MAG: hypothetical protein AAF420_01440 [Pseudomonadota bacterium]
MKVCLWRAPRLLTDIVVTEIERTSQFSVVTIEDELSLTEVAELLAVERVFALITGETALSDEAVSALLFRFPRSGVATLSDKGVNLLFFSLERRATRFHQSSISDVLDWVASLDSRQSAVSATGEGNV